MMQFFAHPVLGTVNKQKNIVIMYAIVRTSKVIKKLKPTTD